MLFCKQTSQRRRVLISSIGLTALCSLPAMATQGTFPHGYGVKSEGMGGVVVALPQDAVVGASNPAGMLSVGDRVDVGVAFLQADNGVDFNGVNADGGADGDLYIIPQFGYNQLLDEQSSLGVSVVGNGVGTQYADDENIGGMEGPGSEFQQIVTTVSYARQLTANQTVGIGLMAIYQVLEVDGTASIGLPEGRDSAYGSGLRVGWMGSFGEYLTLGAAYASRGYMSKMKKFENLLAEGGDMDMPANYAFGAAYQRSDWTFALDVQHIFWSDVKTFGNPGVSSASGATGSSSGAGFGWNDQTVWKLGLAWQASDALTLRAGYNDANQLVDSDSTYLGLLAPAANHRHVTIGSTYTTAAGSEWSVAYARSFEGKVKGTGAAPDSLTDPYMSQHWLSFAYGSRF
ncbi:OmpP1/FadL family transporter [Oceanobacter mangrovi]|uniref:OmpP1/FadL family transporter n=1 Tax=Oceanobacter mangrovi TaxID=2862510 RepID=UPI001C8D2EBE|nr:outer membrane protein transport protein [Oceanobacter mangrovi]